MKENLTDVTFLILVRLDSIHRLENIIIITEQLIHYFKTNIVVWEVDKYCNGLLRGLLNKKIQYCFIEDRDPVLYKTKYFNQMRAWANTLYTSIWDVDIVPDKKAIIECLTQLRNNNADISYPYNGICYDVTEILKPLYFKKKDVRLLYRHKNKMNLLYPYPLVGGAIIMNRDKYIQAGGENETHYGWGNDDFDRYYRFISLNYVIYRVNTCLFHLAHPRGNNSRFYSSISEKISVAERCMIENNSKDEILNYNFQNEEYILSKDILVKYVKED